MMQDAHSLTGSLIAVACPSCGAPTPASLLTTEALRCRSCGYAGLPSEQARQRLGALGYLLTQFDVKERQLSSTQRRVLLFAKAFRVMFWFLVINLALPLVCVAFYLLALPFVGAKDVALLIGGGIPIFVLAAAGLVAVWITLRRRERLLDACAALPPLSDGEPARCHVCGGPVVPEAGSAIARCGYCNADNFTSPEALSRSRARRWNAAEEIEAEVRQQASATSRTTMGWAVSLALLNFFTLPMTLFGSCALAGAGVYRAELPPDDGPRYVLWTREGLSCYGEVRSGSSGGSRLSFGADRPAGWPAITEVPAGTSLKPIAASTLEGQTVYVDALDVGKVESVYRTAFGEGNAVRAKGPAGWGTRSVTGACVAGPKNSVAIDVLDGPGRLMAKDASAAYIAMGTPGSSQVWRIPFDGSASRRIAASADHIALLTTAGDDVYYSGRQKIWTVPKTGGIARQVYSTQSSEEFAVDSTSLYVYSSSAVRRTYEIQSVPRMGGKAKALATSEEMPCCISQHGEHVYWFTCTQAMTFGGGSLLRARKADGAVEVLNARALRPFLGTRPAFTETTMLWVAIDGSDFQVISVPLTGGETTTLATPKVIRGFDINGKYALIGRDGAIDWISLADHTTGSIALPGGSGSCSGLAARPDLIVYADDRARRIVRMPLL